MGSLKHVTTHAIPSAPAAEDLAGLFKALSDPTRLRIVSMLAADGAELCACDIESAFELSQPTISHHLKLLRTAGLVSAEKRGLWVYYSLRAGRLDRARELLSALDAPSPKLASNG